MKNEEEKIGWLRKVGRMMRLEFDLIRRDEAVIIFFVLLAIVYPP